MLTAHVFSIMLSTSPGIFGFALMLAIISALITDEKVEKVKKLLGIRFFKGHLQDDLFLIVNAIYKSGQQAPL